VAVAASAASQLSPFEPPQQKERTSPHSNGTFLISTGRPKGVRNRLQRGFLHALAEDFEEHGADAIRICRIEEPARYVQIIASLMPRELEIEHGLIDDVSDEELEQMITRLRAEIAQDAEKPMLIEAKLVETEKK
jgi:hypothetical protein